MPARRPKGRARVTPKLCSELQTKGQEGADGAAQLGVPQHIRRARRKGSACHRPPGNECVPWLERGTETPRAELGARLEEGVGCSRTGLATCPQHWHFLEDALLIASGKCQGETSPSTQSHGQMHS